MTELSNVCICKFLSVCVYAHKCTDMALTIKKQQWTRSGEAKGLRGREEALTLTEQTQSVRLNSKSVLLFKGTRRSHMKCLEAVARSLLK